jgi:putative oxidoreductase
MRILVIIARVLLGLMFVVFGLNGFFMFLKPPSMPTGLAGQYGEVLFKSHLLWLVAGCQVIGGALLLLNRYVTLGLVILGPVLVNILAYHITMDMKGIVPGLVCTILWAIIAWSARGNLRGIFEPRTHA